MRSKKINKLYAVAPISRILRKPATNMDELKKLANSIGINPIKIEWVRDYDPKTEIPQILNMGSPDPRMMGTHWTAVAEVNGRRMYFDSYGLPPTYEILRKSPDIEYSPLTIQSSMSGGCGQYALLFIHYALQNELDEFFALFNMTNTFSERD